METLKQALKYGVVGLGNTLITAAIIWVMMKVFGLSSGLSNVIGYLAGLVNSFFWNKQWTFKSSQGWLSSGLRFGIAWLLCYGLQFSLFTYLDRELTIDPYYNQLIAMVFFTAINFVVNKFYTFKK